MATKTSTSNLRRGITAQPRIHQRAKEIQQYGTVTSLLCLWNLNSRYGWR